MHRHAKRSKPAAIQILVVAAGLLLLIAAYALVMHLTVDISREGNSDADTRDLMYLYIHLGGLLGALVVGFSLGRWLSGLGIAFAVLFVVVLACSMVIAQAGTYQLACHGQNDILRHWSCEQTSPAAAARH